MDKKDISTSEDVQLLVYSFYERALVDDDIGSIFQEQIGMDLKNHLPIICSFWDSVLLGKDNYKRNPILKHIELAKKVELKKVHFDRWLALWEASISFHFTGPIAEMAWKRAKVMAQLMLYKIEESRKGRLHPMIHISKTGMIMTPRSINWKVLPFTKYENR